MNIEKEINEIFSNLAEDLLSKSNITDNIIQEEGYYEIQKSKLIDQLNKYTKNPTQLFYYKAIVDEYHIITITMVSIPVFIKN